MDEEKGSLLLILLRLDVNDKELLSSNVEKGHLGLFLGDLGFLC